MHIGLRRRRKCLNNFFTYQKKCVHSSAAKSVSWMKFLDFLARVCMCVCVCWCLTMENNARFIAHLLLCCNCLIVCKLISLHAALYNSMHLCESNKIRKFINILTSLSPPCLFSAQISQMHRREETRVRERDRPVERSASIPKHHHRLHHHHQSSAAPRSSATSHIQMTAVSITCASLAAHSSRAALAV
jgi:hypothetical protein